MPAEEEAPGGGGVEAPPPPESAASAADEPAPLRARAAGAAPALAALALAVSLAAASASSCSAMRLSSAFLAASAARSWAWRGREIRWRWRLSSFVFVRSISLASSSSNHRHRPSLSARSFASPPMRGRSPLSLDIARHGEKKIPHLYLLLLLRRALALGAVAGGLPVCVFFRLGARPLLGAGAVLLGGLRYGRLAVLCLFLGHLEALAPGPGVRLREQDRRACVRKSRFKRRRRRRRRGPPPILKKANESLSLLSRAALATSLSLCSLKAEVRREGALHGGVLSHRGLLQPRGKKRREGR